MTLKGYAAMMSFMIFISGHSSQKLLDSHDPWKSDGDGRFVRAANPQANSTNFTTISRHMTLARVICAFYLEIQLTYKKLNGKDIVANVWNLESKQDLDKLVSLNFEGVFKELNALSSSISKASHVKETEMVEFKADYARFLRFIDKKKQRLSTVVKIDPLPTLPINLTTIGVQSFNVTLTKDILASIGRLETAVPTELELKKLKKLLNYYGFVLTSIQDDLPQIEQILKSLDALELKLSVVKEFFDSQDNITRIQNVLSKLEKSVNHQSPTNMIHLLEELYSVFFIFDKPLTSFPIGHALHRRLNLTQIQRDIEDKWVKGVINKEEMLQTLSDYYKNAKSVLNPIELITMDSDILFDQNKYNLVRYLHKELITVQRSEAVNKLVNVTNEHCLTLSDKISSREDIGALLQVLQRFRDVKEGIISWQIAKIRIPRYHQLEVEITDLINQFPSSAVFTDQTRDWLNQVKTFVTDNEDTYNKVRPTDLFTGVVSNLTRDSTKNIKLFRDVLDMMAKMKIGKKSCDSMYSLDFAEIINNTNNIINNIKSKRVTKKVIHFVEAVQKMQKSLNELGEETIRISKKISKRSINEVALKDDPSPLLNYSYAASSLEQINKLNDQLSLLIQKGDDVVAVIRKMNDSEDKTELNNSWRDYATLKKKLIEFQTNSIKILEIVNSPKFSKPEKTLEEVGLVYKEISTILIAGSFDLRKMRESMILLNPRISDVESALVYLETPLAMNWNSAQGSFESVPDVLAALQIMPPLEPKTMTEYIIIGIAVILGIIVVAIIVVIVLVCCWMNRQDPDLELEPPPEKAYEAPPDEFIKFTYMQLQDCRLKINSRDPITGNTSLFDAVERRDYVKVRELVDEGVVLDAVCGGESLRTALFQVEFQKNKEMCALLLKNGADQLLVDAAGEDCDTWADYNGVDSIFKKYYDLNRNLSTKPRRIIPKNTPRTWNVLVLDDCKFKSYKRRKLPLRIKKRITWGYEEGNNLDQFTHVVLPSKYVYEKRSLKLDDGDLMTYKLYACKAVLMNKDWLEALVEMKDKAMDEDYNWYVLNTRYNGETHRDTIYNIKTNHYRMVPCLLKNADICILPSTDSDFENDRNEWKKIIEMLGGTYVNMTDIKPDGPKTNTPYWTRTEAYKGEMHEFSQNRCWILKTKGCQINDEWRKDHGMYTLADFKFLTESIARNCILKKDNDVVPLDYEGNSLKGQESKGASTAKSSTAVSLSTKSPLTNSKTPAKSRMVAMKGSPQTADSRRKQLERLERIKQKHTDQLLELENEKSELAKEHGRQEMEIINRQMEYSTAKVNCISKLIKTMYDEDNFNGFRNDCQKIVRIFRKLRRHFDKYLEINREISHLNDASTNLRALITAIQTLVLIQDVEIPEGFRETRNQILEKSSNLQEMIQEIIEKYGNENENEKAAKALIEELDGLVEEINFPVTERFEDVASSIFEELSADILDVRDVQQSIE